MTIFHIARHFESALAASFDEMISHGIDINKYAIEYGEEELRSEFPSGRDIQEEYTGDGVPPELQ